MEEKVNHVGEIHHNRIIIERVDKNWKVKCLKCGKEKILPYTMIKRHGCNDCWKNKINETFFENIDSEAKAYFLGFLFC